MGRLEATSRAEILDVGCGIGGSSRPWRAGGRVSRAGSRSPVQARRANELPGSRVWRMVHVSSRDALNQPRRLQLRPGVVHGERRAHAGQGQVRQRARAGVRAGRRILIVTCATILREGEKTLPEDELPAPRQDLRGYYLPRWCPWWSTRGCARTRAGGRENRGRERAGVGRRHLRTAPTWRSAGYRAAPPRSEAGWSCLSCTRA